jgi:multisubunit Na+/H+ antiporter MnhB subunit
MAATSSVSRATDVAETFSTYLRRGLAAGVVGGIAGALSLWWLGEPSIRDSLEMEARLSQGEAHEETFSRGVQVLGGVTAVLITGIVLGLVLTLVVVKMRNRVALPTDGHVAVAAGALLFLVHGLIPWFKYPPNPPGVGDPETINQRTVSYLALIAVAACALILAYEVAQRLGRRRVELRWRWLAAAAVAVVILAIAYAALPAADPIPESVGADLLWRFRLASLGGLAAMWGVMTLTMAVMCGRRRPAVE